MARKSEIPDPILSSEFINGLYQPEFIPEKLDIANFLVEVDEEEKVQKSLQGKKAPVTLTPDAQSATGVPIPLTEAEAEEADKQIAATLQRIKDTKEKISRTRSLVDRSIKSITAGTTSSGGTGGELSFQMDISRKRSLRRAIKRLFGFKTDTITYSMYKDMLAAKQILETEQAQAYTEGFPEDSEKDKRSKKDKKEKDSRKKKKKRSKDRGFLERSSNQEELDDSGQNEEQYERLFPKIGRDFVYKEDFYAAMDGFLNVVDPAGLNPFIPNTRSDTEARRKAREYKDILDSGRDGSHIYKDLIKLEDDNEEEEL